MANDVDTGNPNFPLNFKGRFIADASGVSTSNVFMLTVTNDVQFTGDCTSDADGLLWTLPEECRPKNPVRLLCATSKQPDVPGATYEVVTEVTPTEKTTTVVAGVSHTTQENTFVTGVTSTGVTGEFLNSFTANTGTYLKASPVSVTNGLTANQYDKMGSAVAVSGVSYKTGKINAVASVGYSTGKVSSVASVGQSTANLKAVESIKVEKGSIAVPGSEGTTMGTLTIGSDGTVRGLPNLTYYANGLSFSVSDRWYLEGE